MRRRQRRRADAVDDVGERKAKLVGLVKRHFQHPCDDLHRSGQALGRRIEEGEAGGRQAAVARATLSTTSAGGGSALSSTSTAALGLFLVAQRSVERLDAGQRPRRSRAEREKFVRSCVRLQPAYWLPRQASTGCEERTSTATGHCCDARSTASETLPSPPIDASAILRPASTDPVALAPASISVSPDAPRRTPSRSRSASRIMPSATARALALSRAEPFFIGFSPARRARARPRSASATVSLGRRCRPGQRSCTPGRPLRAHCRRFGGRRSNRASRAPESGRSAPRHRRPLRPCNRQSAAAERQAAGGADMGVRSGASGESNRSSVAPGRGLTSISRQAPAAQR